MQLNSPEIQSIQKQTLKIVMICQVLGGLGFAAGITVGALLANEMLSSESLSGLPIALFTMGSALAALLVGNFTQKYGRRISLSVGFIIGGIGALGVIFAATSNSIPLLFIGLFLYGSGTSTNLQTRYAATDLAQLDHRGRAISMALVSTTIGAVAGPNLVTPLGSLAKFLNIPLLSGPFVLAAAAYFSAGLVLLLMLKPDPFIVAKKISKDSTTSVKETTNKQSTNMIKSKNTGLFIGATIMVLIQIIMIAIMTMTPIHMKHHGMHLGSIGLVIGIHIGAMFLPSPITGSLVDKIGRTRMIIASGLTLLASGFFAAFTPGDSLILLIISLALLGLGWNFGLISGTALIVDNTNLENRAKVQGLIDMLFAIAGAAGGVASGLIMSATSFAVLSILSALLTVILVPIFAFSRNYTK